MQKDLDYKDACKLFKDLRPEALNDTYKKAAQFYDKALEERVGEYWKDAFIGHMVSHYV